MWTERVIAFLCVVCAAFILGLIVARAYGNRKHKSMREELERLRHWKESTKGLCDKLQDGEDGDYLPSELTKKDIELIEHQKTMKEEIANAFKIKPKPEEDDDTKTGDLEIEKATQGHPNDA